MTTQEQTDDAGNKAEAAARLAAKADAAHDALIEAHENEDPGLESHGEAVDDATEAFEAANEAAGTALAAFSEAVTPLGDPFLSRIDLLLSSLMDDRDGAEAWGMAESLLWTASTHVAHGE